MVLDFQPSIQCCYKPVLIDTPIWTQVFSQAAALEHHESRAALELKDLGILDAYHYVQLDTGFPLPCSDISAQLGDS